MTHIPCLPVLSSWATAAKSYCSTECETNVTNPFSLAVPLPPRPCARVSTGQLNLIAQHLNRRHYSPLSYRLNAPCTSDLARLHLHSLLPRWDVNATQNVTKDHLTIGSYSVTSCLNHMNLPTASSRLCMQENVWTNTELIHWWNSWNGGRRKNRDLELDFLGFKNMFHDSVLHNFGWGLVRPWHSANLPFLLCNIILVVQYSN